MSREDIYAQHNYILERLATYQFSDIDHEKSGKINFDEFKQIFQDELDQGHLTEQNLRNFFDDFDHNRDGTLNYNEFRGASDVERSLMEEVDLFVDMLDRDGNATGAQAAAGGAAPAPRGQPEYDSGYQGQADPGADEEAMAGGMPETSNDMRDIRIEKLQRMMQDRGLDTRDDEADYGAINQGYQPAAKATQPVYYRVVSEEMEITREIQPNSELVAKLPTGEFLVLSEESQQGDHRVKVKTVDATLESVRHLGVVEYDGLENPFNKRDEYIEGWCTVETGALRSLESIQSQDLYQVTIKVLKANNLPDSDTGNGTCDPYVQVSLRDNKRGRTDHIMNTLNPEWETNNVFTECYTRRADINKITFTLMDWDGAMKFGFVGHDTIGYASVNGLLAQGKDIWDINRWESLYNSGRQTWQLKIRSGRDGNSGDDLGTINVEIRIKALAVRSIAFGKFERALSERAREPAAQRVHAMRMLIRACRDNTQRDSSFIKMFTETCLRPLCGQLRDREVARAACMTIEALAELFREENLNFAELTPLILPALYECLTLSVEISSAADKCIEYILRYVKEDQNQSLLTQIREGASQGQPAAVRRCIYSGLRSFFQKGDIDGALSDGDYQGDIANLLRAGVEDPNDDVASAALAALVAFKAVPGCELLYSQIKDALDQGKEDALLQVERELDRQAAYYGPDKVDYQPTPFGPIDPAVKLAKQIFEINLEPLQSNLAKRIRNGDIDAKSYFKELVAKHCEDVIVDVAPILEEGRFVYGVPKVNQLKCEVRAVARHVQSVDEQWIAAVTQNIDNAKALIENMCRFKEDDVVLIQLHGRYFEGVIRAVEEDGRRPGIISVQPFQERDYTYEKTLAYNCIPAKCTVTVTVERATGLPPNWESGIGNDRQPDPYVEIYVDAECKDPKLQKGIGRTRAIDNQTSPEWNETFTAGPTKCEIEYLHFVVMDSNYTIDTVIGYGRLRLRDKWGCKNKRECLTVFEQKQEVGETRGKLWVEITCTVTGEGGVGSEAIYEPEELTTTPARVGREPVGALAPSPTRRERELIRLFNDYDVNCDSVLSRDEFRRMIERLSSGRDALPINFEDLAGDQEYIGQAGFIEFFNQNPQLYDRLVNGDNSCQTAMASYKQDELQRELAEKSIQIRRIRDDIRRTRLLLERTRFQADTERLRQELDMLELRETNALRDQADLQKTLERATLEEEILRVKEQIDTEARKMQDLDKASGWVKQWLRDAGKKYKQLDLDQDNAITMQEINDRFPDVPMWQREELFRMLDEERKGQVDLTPFDPRVADSKPRGYQHDSVSYLRDRLVKLGAVHANYLISDIRLVRQYMINNEPPCTWTKFKKRLDDERDRKFLDGPQFSRNSASKPEGYEYEVALQAIARRMIEVEITSRLAKRGGGNGSYQLTFGEMQDLLEAEFAPNRENVRVLRDFFQSSDANTNGILEVNKFKCNKWSKYDCARYFTLLGFGKYRDEVIRQGIEGRHIKDLTDKDLKAMGVRQLGSREKLLSLMDDIVRRNKSLSEEANLGGVEPPARGVPTGEGSLQGSGGDYYKRRQQAQQQGVGVGDWLMSWWS